MRRTPAHPVPPRLLPLLLVVLVLPASTAADPADGPPMRIRLTTGPEDATLACDGGLRVLDRDSGRPLGPDPFGPRAIVVAEHSGPRPAPVFRAQVASLTSEEEARKLAADLGSRLGVPHRVHYHADRRAWRVRLGGGGASSDLDDLVRRLADLGYDQVWVTEDVPDAERGSLRVVDAGWNDYPAPGPALRIVPAAGCDRIRVGEGTYRGAMEVQLDRRGRLTVINQLPMEQYLRGVVPNELGPVLFPEVEALKAQAVAARTYAWRNLGQFAEDGYDLCDTPRCQVYKGAGTEHAMTDQAILATAGLVAVYDGEPIHALYSANCGGHTEEGSKVFVEETGAYLQPVRCYAGKGSARHAWVLSGRTPGPWLQAAGQSLGRDLYVLDALGVLQPGDWDAEDLRSPIPSPEAAAWIDRTLKATGKRRASGGPGSVKSRDDLVRDLVRRLGWEGRAEIRLSSRDLAYLLDFPDAGGIGRKGRESWALLLKDGLITPFPDGTLRPRAAPTRAGLARTLAKLVRHYDAEGLTRGSLRGVVGDTILLEVGEEERVLILPTDARLVKTLRGEGIPVPRLEVLVGDKIDFRSHENAQGEEVTDYAEVHPSAKSASDDRFTKVYEWRVRLEREELEGLLEGHVRGIGRFRDLEVLERGVSGRVTALAVLGSSGRQVLRGFPIRTALGLRETRFAIDRLRGPDGQVTAFLFTGKGWGHGVGMCQVGAYGMAMRGAAYEDILRHYYTGIALERMYP